MTPFEETPFSSRHIGPRNRDLASTLETVGASSMEQLIDQTIPEAIRLKTAPALAPPVGEHEFLADLRAIARKNRLMKSYLGQGYYGCVTPTVIQRNVFENPGWYTVHSISARNIPGTPGGVAQLPDDGEGHDRDGGGKCLPPR